MTKAFYKALNKGKGVFKAVKIAKLKVPKWQRKRLGFRMSKSSGADFNDKLLPARYGRKKRGWMPGMGEM